MATRCVHVSGLSARREPSRAWRVVSRVTGGYMESARARRRDGALFTRHTALTSHTLISRAMSMSRARLVDGKTSEVRI